MLSQQAFDAVTRLFESVSGIHLGASKRPLVEGRLQKLAQRSGAASVEAYVAQLLAERDPHALTEVVDKLTTNETYFFREPQHFERLANMLRDRAAAGGAGGPFRVWSAASSSGEEAYSIAMVLAERLGPNGWEVIGTDLSTAMVETAQRGVYPMTRAQGIPAAYLKRYCLRGFGPHAGELLIARELREHVHFLPVNLKRELPPLGDFDVIFLRNVLIYFDMAGKADIAARVAAQLRPGGELFTGHAESLVSLNLPLRALGAAVYCHA